MASLVIIVQINKVEAGEGRIIQNRDATESWARVETEDASLSLAIANIVK